MSTTPRGAGSSGHGAIATSGVIPALPGSDDDAGTGTAARSLFTALVDDAAVFPPGLAPMAEAVPSHARHVRAWYGDVLGPFLVPAGQGGAFAAAVSHLANSEPVRVAVVADPASHDPLGDGLSALRTVGDLPGVDVVALEVPLPTDVDQDAAAETALDRLSAVPAGVQVWLEVHPEGAWQQALRRIGAAGDDVGAKFRTGGTTADAVPPVEVLAGFLRTAVDAEVTVKLTAGLHQAVAGPDPDLGWHHGVLNVLGAVRAALNGAETDEVAEVLAVSTPARLASAMRRMSDADAAVVRAFLASFGCCGVSDPIHDLVALGLLEESR